MESNKLRVVFDIDSTLNKLDEYVYGEVGILHKLENQKRYQLEHEMNSLLTSEDREKIHALWEDYDTFIKCPMDEDIDEVVKMSLSDSFSVIIHSTCMAEEVAKAKEVVMSEYFDKSNVQFVFEICTKNQLENIFAVVEDNIEYLKDLKATHKLLLDRPYNKAENYNIIESDYNITRVATLKEAVERIKAWQQQIA